MRRKSVKAKVRRGHHVDSRQHYYKQPPDHSYLRLRAPQALSLPKAAEIKGVAYLTVWNAVRRGTIPCVAIQRKDKITYGVNLADLRKWQPRGNSKGIPKEKPDPTALAAHLESRQTKPPNLHASLSIPGQDNDPHTPLQSNSPFPQDDNDPISPKEGENEGGD